jgi:hypothetical protein
MNYPVYSGVVSSVVKVATTQSFKPENKIKAKKNRHICGKYFQLEPTFLKSRPTLLLT